LDTNVLRVGRRLLFPPTAAPSRGEVARAATGAFGGTGPAVFHALMDVGATLCRARRTACDACPLRPSCLSAGSDPPPVVPGARRQAAYEGSRREARGSVLRRLQAEGSVRR